MVIANGGGGGAQQSAQFGQTTTQTVFLEEVGLIEVEWTDRTARTLLP